MIEVVKAGPLTTIQDRGRAGCAHLGVPRAGALDAPALARANALVGNEPDAAGLEITLTGCTLRFGVPAIVAITGASAVVAVDGEAQPRNTPLLVRPTGTLKIGPALGGVRTYLAVRGGIDVPPVLGSRSRDTLAGIGPPPLRSGDTLPIGPTSTPQPDNITNPSTPELHDPHNYPEVARSEPDHLRNYPDPVGSDAHDPHDYPEVARLEADHLRNYPEPVGSDAHDPHDYPEVAGSEADHLRNYPELVGSDAHDPHNYPELAKSEADHARNYPEIAGSEAHDPHNYPEVAVTGGPGTGETTEVAASTEVTEVGEITEVVVLRVRFGPRDDWFHASAPDVLCGSAYTLTISSNRIGARFSGEPLLRADPAVELPSEGLVLGAVQVATDGMPIVFLADHPTTGGYPVIAVVDERDVFRLAQVRPGATVRFRR